MQELSSQSPVFHLLQSCLHCCALYFFTDMLGVNSSSRLTGLEPATSVSTCINYNNIVSREWGGQARPHALVASDASRVPTAHKERIQHTGVLFNVPNNTQTPCAQ